MQEMHKEAWNRCADDPLYLILVIGSLFNQMYQNRTLQQTVFAEHFAHVHKFSFEILLKIALIKSNFVFNSDLLSLPESMRILKGIFEFPPILQEFFSMVRWLFSPPNSDAVQICLLVSVENDASYQISKMLCELALTSRKIFSDLEQEMEGAIKGPNMPRLISIVDFSFQEPGAYQTLSKIFVELEALPAPKPALVVDCRDEPHPSNEDAFLLDFIRGKCKILNVGRANECYNSMYLALNPASIFYCTPDALATSRL